MHLYILGTQLLCSPVTHWIMSTVPFCIDSHAMKKLFLLLLKHSNFTIYPFYNLNIILVIISPFLPLKHIIASTNSLLFYNHYSCLRYQYILFPPPPLIIDVLPLNSLFWFPPIAVHRFDASDMAVPGIYISWFKWSKK